MAKSSQRWISIPQGKLNEFPFFMDSPAKSQESAAQNAISYMEEDEEEGLVYICYIVGVVRRPKGQYISYEQARSERLVE